MAHWLLTAVDHRAEIWNTYPIQRLVVEAPNEREASKQVAAAAPAVSLPNPWLDPILTSCEVAKTPVEKAGTKITARRPAADRQGARRRWRG
jgi:hypothetical protein